MYFILYLFLTSVAASIYMAIWIQSQGATSLNQVELAQLAQVSIDVQIVSGLIGLAGLLTVALLIWRRKSGDKRALLRQFLICLLLFSFQSVLLHIEHHWLYQVLKVAIPILCIIAIGRTPVEKSPSVTG